jgi:methionine sulfoxide reductase heme-binding subunit
MTSRDPFDYTWWLASRAAGIVGFVALGTVAVLGLLSALKVFSPKVNARLRPYHERLALTGLGAIAVHGTLLLADPWLHPGVRGLLIPFTMGYRPFATGLGVIAFYALCAFGLSFYQRRRIGPRRWRSAHRFASLAFVLGGLHALLAGTDAGSPLLRWTILGFLALAAILGAARALGFPRHRRPSPPRTRARPPVAA